jgi:hypothetical protein
MEGSAKHRANNIEQPIVDRADGVRGRDSAVAHAAIAMVGASRRHPSHTAVGPDRLYGGPRSFA